MKIAKASLVSPDRNFWYGLTAVVAAWALDVGSPIWAVFGGVAVTLVLTAVSAAAERRQPR